MMVFEPNFSKVVSSVRKNIGITQSRVEIKLPTDQSNITAIYSVSARSVILSKETSGKEVNIDGLIDFQAMYQSDEVCAIDYSAEFKDKFVATEDLNGELVVSSNVIDVTSTIVSGGIKVCAIVEISVDEISSVDNNVLLTIDNNGVFSSSKEIKYSTYLGKAYEKYELMQDIQIKNANKILMVTPCVSLKSIEPKDNYIVVNGCVNADVCYLTGGNVKDVANTDYVFDFSFEVALTGVDDNSYVQSDISLLYNEIKVSSNLEEDFATVNMFIPLMYSGYVFNSSTIEVVDDVYSENNYLSVTTELMSTLEEQKYVSFKDSINGTAEVMETSPFIDDVVCVTTNNIVLATSTVLDGKLSIEGVVNSSVLYYTKETESLTSVLVEMPFAVEEKIEGDCSGVVTLCLSNLSARSRRGKEIEVSAELNVFADMYSIKHECVISDLSLGDEKPKDDCSLYIYLVKPNQTVWDIAKEMNVSQELILEQNAEVELPLRGGERLVIYKPSIVEY